MRLVTASIVSVLCVAVTMGAQAPTAPAPQIVWSPKATTPSDWTPPHRPHVKLAELLGKHKGHADWAETMVR
jgi:hypothetical protein